MSSNTNKLKLLKVDPVADGEQYFNIDTMLNENWDKVDTYAQEMASKVDDNLLPRLDTVKIKELTLQPGLQIVNAEKTSPFQLTGLKGRTLLNLSGSDWTPTKNITRFINYQSTLSIDNNKSVTSGNALKITAAVANSIADGFGKNAVNLISGKKYIALGHLYNETGQSMKLAIQNTAIESPLTTSKNKWEFKYIVFSAGGDVSNAYPIARLNASAVGNVGYADAIRLYEISDTEYTALTAMTSEQIAAAYPYVDSLSPVRNPYVIAYGENLLPALQEWTNIEGAPIINNRYSVDVSSTNKIIHSSIAVVPGGTYTLSAISSGSTGRIFVYHTNGAIALADNSGSGSISATFKVPAGVNIIEVRLLGTSTTAVNLSNIMLNVGSTAKSFKPREDTMLALQTDLYADPVTGENADEVFERDGQYFRLTKWKKYITGTETIVTASSNFPNYKWFWLKPLVDIVKNSGYSIKYDGKLLTKILAGSAPTASDQYVILDSTDANPNTILLTIGNSDSGWGDNYTPTVEEIRAYFLGWKMFTDGQDALINQYNGSGTKRWVKIGHTVTSNIPQADYTSSISQIGYGYVNLSKSYELVYQLAKPFLEPIISEGQLLLQEGDNQVEVGSGIIVRESVKPELGKIGINADRSGYNINNPSSSTSSLTKNKIDHFISIYKNNKIDQWVYYDKSLTAAGAIAQKEYTDYDQTAAYSVTYIMLNKLPRTSFSGKLSLNEGTLLNQLIRSESELDTRLSIVENKKSNIEESLVWINPTMLNGWFNVPGRPSLAYSIKGDTIRIRGEIKSGAIGTVVFVLPVSMRPQANASEYIVYSYSKSGIVGASIVILSDGRFVVQNGSSEQISLGNIEFSL